MQPSIYIGLDLGSSSCQQTIINADGALQLSRTIPTSEQNLRHAFANLQGDVQVHIEAGELANWVSSIIKPLVKQVVVSHPRSLAWIGKDAVKDDRIDARKLAELLRVHLVHAVYCEADNQRQTFKQLVVHYEDLSHEQARLKSKIKARLRTLGIIRKDAQIFSIGGQTELLDELKEPLVKQMLMHSFAVLNQMIDCQREAKAAMVAFSSHFPEVRLLQTTPGVGEILACRFVAYIQTPKRFSNKQKLWRYARLGITRRESNGKRLAHPRLDSAGVGSLKDVSRKIFEAALRCKKDNSFKRFFEQSLLNTKNAVHARLSTQRKILATLRAMWLSMKPYQDSGD